MSDDVTLFLSAAAGAATAAAERLVAGGRAAELSDAVLGAVAGEDGWTRERTLERVRALPAGLVAALLAILGEALHSQDPERRNAARSTLATLTSAEAPASGEALSELEALVTADADPGVRVLAASALGESGNPQALPLLQRALDDPDANVAAAAADALGEIGDAHALDALAARAEHGEFWTRAAAILALGRLRDARALPVLTRALADPLIAEAAATSLGEIGDPGALGALRPLAAAGPAKQTAQRSAARILTAHPEVPVPDWLRAALVGSEAELHTEFSERGDETAAFLLGIAGTRQAATLLIAALDEPQAAAAAAALAALPRDLAQRALMTRLRRRDPRARAELLLALPPLEAADAVDTVLEFLGDGEPAVRAAAAEALARSDGELVVPRLLAALERDALRLGAIQALGRLGDERCEPLAGLLDAREPEIRRAAAEALARCATPAIRERIAASLRAETDAATKRALITALAAAGGSQAVDQLAPLLGDADPAVRFAALHALGRTGSRDALPPLLEALGSPMPELRAAALQALGALGEASAAEPIAERLDDADRDIRRTAAYALRELASPQAAEHLLRALDDPAWAVRHAAVRTLERIGAAGAIARLAQMADDDPDPLVRQAARNAVARQSPAAPGE